MNTVLEPYFSLFSERVTDNTRGRAGMSPCDLGIESEETASRTLFSLI